MSSASNLGLDWDMFFTALWVFGMSSLSYKLATTLPPRNDSHLREERQESAREKMYDRRVDDGTIEPHCRVIL